MACLGAILVCLSGCLFAPSGDWCEAEGRSVKDLWDQTGAARQRARQEAMGQARRQIYDTLLQERVDVVDLDWAKAEVPRPEREVSLEYLAIANPAFHSRFRALIGSLLPAEITDEPSGEIAVRLRLDRHEVLGLARTYIVRMRRQGRLAQKR